MSFSNINKRWLSFFIFSILFGFSFFYYLGQIDELRFTIYQERDIFRAYDIFSRKIGILYGPDTRAEGLLVGPFFYFIISALTFFTDYWRSSYLVLVILQSLFVSLMALTLFQKYGLVALSVVIGGLFFSAYPTNQFLKFFNPSYLPIFMLLSTLLLSRLLEKPIESGTPIAFLLGLLCSVGLQIHAQFYYFIIASSLALIIYKEKRASIYISFIIGLLAPMAGAWIYYKLLGYEIIYPQSGQYVAYDMKNFIKKILNRSTDLERISLRALDFFTYLFPFAVFLFFRNKQKSIKQQGALIVVSLLLASVSWIGALPYLLAGTTSRYGQTFGFATLLFCACALGIYFLEKSARKKGIAAATIIAIFCATFYFTPNFLRDDKSFADIGMSKMLMVYRITKSISGLDGIFLASRIFSLNTEFEQLTFKAFQKFAGSAGQSLPEYGPAKPDLSFFIYKNYSSQGYSEDWAKETLPNYLPEIINAAIKNKEITLLPPIIHKDIWVIPYSASGQKKYPSGFTNFSFGYQTENDHLFLKNSSRVDSKVDIRQSNIETKEVNFQLALCSLPQKEYCLVNQNIKLKKNGPETTMLAETNGAGLSNNTVFKDAHSLVIERLVFSVLCGNKNLSFRAIDSLGAAISGFDDYLKNISAPFTINLRVPCNLNEIKSVKSSFDYYMRSNPIKNNSQLEAIF